jgi:hypothetical protein
MTKFVSGVYRAEQDARNAPQRSIDEIFKSTVAAKRRPRRTRRVRATPSGQDYSRPATPELLKSYRRQQGERED